MLSQRAFHAIIGRPTVTALVKGKCDYCDRDKAFSGADPITLTVISACYEHKSKAQKRVDDNYKRNYYHPTNERKVEDER